MDITPYFSAVDDYSVMLHGGRCATCGEYSFPNRLTCRSCHGRQIEAADMAGRGQVRTWALVEIPPAGFDHPIVVGEVVLDEGPTIFTLLTSEPTTSRVVAVPHPVRDGAPGYAFRSIA